MKATEGIKNSNEMTGTAVSNGEMSPVVKRIATWGIILMFTFLLGFVPVWLTARESASQRDAAQANLRLSQLQNRLATAAINARRGEYEPARIAASDFFTDLRKEIDRPESGFTQLQLNGVRPILAGRDDVITLLARYDAAAAERLTDLYISYVQAVNATVQRTQ